MHVLTPLEVSVMIVVEADDHVRKMSGLQPVVAVVGLGVSVSGVGIWPRRMKEWRWWGARGPGPLGSHARVGNAMAL